MNELAGKRILFFVPESNIQTNAVHASQVGGLAKYVASLGAEVLVFQAATTLTDKEYDLVEHVHVINDLFSRKKVKFYSVPSLFRRLAERYERELTEFRPTHIYTRHYATCFGARELANKTGAKLIFSVRGPSAEEKRRGGGIKSWIASVVIGWQEDAAMKSCDILSTLSYAYADYLAKRYAREVVGVIPCCTTDLFFNHINTEERACLRESFGFKTDDRIVVWSGSFAHWQCLDQVVKMMKGVCQLDSQYKILFLLRDENALAKLCQEVGFAETCWRTKSCQPTEVPRYLQCADIGINLQEPTTLHSRTCSPIKIAEYLASGLPVLVTRVMGDMPKMLAQDGVGRILPDALDADAVLSQMKGFEGFDRKKAVECARKRFLWESNRIEIVKLFSR